MTFFLSIMETQHDCEADKGDMDSPIASGGGSTRGYMTESKKTDVYDRSSPAMDMIWYQMPTHDERVAVSISASDKDPVNILKVIHECPEQETCAFTYDDSKIRQLMLGSPEKKSQSSVIPGQVQNCKPTACGEPSGS